MTTVRRQGSMTTFVIGPESLPAPVPATPRDGCYECGGRTWVPARWDWKEGPAIRRNVLTLKCVGCGRHRRI